MILGVLAMFMTFSTSVLAGDGSLTVNATVLTSASVTQNTALNFGTFALTDDSSAGTVDTTGAATSNVDQMSAPTAGVVDISGTASTVVNISVTNATLAGPGADMIATLTVPSATVTTDGSGAATSNVNGTLAVAAGQAPGSYTGTASVIVAY